MAEEQKETFGQKVDNYANQYEAALRENAEAFRKVGMECIAKGIKTAEEVVQDAKNAGIAIKQQTLAQMKKAESFVKQKATETKSKVTEVKGKVVNRAGEIKDGVVDGAAKTAEAFVTVGRLGKNAVIKGAKTVQGKSEKVYSAAKGTAQKGLTAVGKWFQARGKDIRDAKDAVVTKAGQVRDDVKDKAETAAIYGMMAGDKVVETARKVRNGAKDAVETVAIYGLEAKDRVVDAAETAAIYGMMAGDKVVETAGKVKDGVVDGAAKVVAVPVTAKNMTQEMLQRASSRVQTRANTTIASMARSGRNFADALFDRLESSAISREERNQEAMKAREAAKAKEESSKDQDDPSK